MKYYFPVHLDGGNRGCEAIAKGTALVLDENKDNLVGYCRDIPLDSRLGIDEYYQLQPYRKLTIPIRAWWKFYRNFITKEDFKELQQSFLYDRFLDQVTTDDFMLSTGGDMLCYVNNMVNYTVDYLKNKGQKSVLWGCSVGEDNLTPEKLVSLQNFSAVVVRESLTKELFLKLGLKNVYQFPDPAFILQPEECEWPSGFPKKNIIGINLSNFVTNDVSAHSIIGKNLRNLISYILKETSYSIIFIPHVFWHEQDDRIVCSQLVIEFAATGRVYLLDSERYNYCQIRYFISKCDMFIGARTHAVISAYSTCIPAFALGYSVKSVGIAKDLGMSSKSVADCIHLSHPTELVDKFKDFIPLVDSQRYQLEKIMPEYVAQMAEMKEIFRKL